MALSILHISDLHYSRRNSEQRNFLASKFFDDLRVTLEKQGKVDAIVFSGDIVNNPDEEDVYLYAVDNFFDKLVQISGVNPESIVFCPGNHDVSRSEIEKNELTRNALSGNAGDVNFLEKYIENDGLLRYVWVINKGFFDFCDYMGSAWQNPFYKNYRVGDQDLISLNSSFMCSRDGSATDRGKLAFPPSAFESAVAACRGSKILGIVNHFPLTDWSESAHRILAPRISDVSQFLFCGHLHNANPIVAVSPESKNITLQSGALYARFENFKGYSYTSIEDGLVVSRYRSYYDQRGVYDVATNVASGGVFYPDIESRKHWEGKSAPYSKEEMLVHLEGGVREHYMQSLNVGILGSSIYDTYVFPTFGEVDISTTDETGQAAEISRGELDLKSVDDHICCLFTDETGATSFLSYLAIELSVSCRRVGIPRIPIYVDIRASKGYPAAVASQIKAGMPVIEHSVFGWSARSVDQPYVILVDNFDPNEAEHRRWMVEAYQLLPKARFIVCAKAPFAMHGTKSRPKVDLPFGHRTWVLYPFDRSQVRGLVKKYELPENLNSDVIVEEIRFKFRAIGIPLTGPMICMYLTVLKEKKKYAPINAAAVIENFVEQALGKGASPIVYQDDFDYGEQISILSFCAEAYVRLNLESMEFSDIYNVVNEYYKKLGMKRDAQKIIKHFINKSIFENYANKIYFRYKVVFSFLIAKRMGEDKPFKDFILDVERVSEFVSEVDMYTGINRGDLETLRAIEAIHDRWTTEMRDEFGPYVDVASVTDVKLPNTSNIEEFVKMMQARVDASHTPEDRDAHVGGRT